MITSPDFFCEDADIESSDPSTPVQNFFNEINFDFLQELVYQECAEFNDCCLSQDELREFFRPPSAGQWKDMDPKNFPAVLKMDESKTHQWKLAKEEIRHIKKSVHDILNVNEGDEFPFDRLVMHAIGPESEVGAFLCKEVNLSHEQYIEFMSTLCIQSAYRVSSRELFSRHSLLKNHTTMTESDYNKIWKDMASLRKLPRTEMRTSRRQIPLWETLETKVNELHFNHRAHRKDIRGSRR